MQVELLDDHNPAYCPDLWRRLDAIYRAGEAFRSCIREFLPPNEYESERTYELRRKSAPFRSYVGPIVDFFVANLFSAPLTTRAMSRVTHKTNQELPDYYGALKEDCDGVGTDLVPFVAGRMTQALVKGRSWIELVRPAHVATRSRAEWERLGLGDVKLRAVDNEQVVDWETDKDDQRLIWLRTHEVMRRRDDPFSGRGRIVEVWKTYTREACVTHSMAWDPATEQRPKNAPETDSFEHGFGDVPFVRMGFVGVDAVRMPTRPGASTSRLLATELEGLWLANRLYDSQVEHFQLAAAMSYNLKRTCYAMPVFRLADNASEPVIGAGYGIRLGLNEEVSWIAPPTDHLSVLQQQLHTEREELYRVANQMVQGIDNNAAAIGRSGESKSVDAAAVETCLRVYGSIAREAVERVYDLISRVRGEHDIAWSVEGLDTFNVGDLEKTLEGTAGARLADVKSPTYWREAKARIVDLTLPHIDQQTKEQIRAELEAESLAPLHLEDDDDPADEPAGADDPADDGGGDEA